MGRTWNQFRLLSWKNWVLQSRRVLVTVFEILIPLIFAALLLIIRSFVDFNTFENPTLYGSFAINQLPQTLLPPNVTDNSTLPPFYWRIAYAPRGPAADDIMERVVDRLSGQFVIINPVQLEEGKLASLSFLTLKVYPN